MFSPDGGLPAAPFGLLPDGGPPFPRGGYDGAAAQQLFFPFASEPDGARDAATARAWLPPPAVPPAKAEARPARPCRQGSPEPRAAPPATPCCGPAWAAPPWPGPAPPAATAVPGPPFPGPAAAAFPAAPGHALCPAALQPSSGGLANLGSSGSSSGAASEGGHSSDSGDEVSSPPPRAPRPPSPAPPTPPGLGRRSPRRLIRSRRQCPTPRASRVGPAAAVRPSAGPR